LSFKHYFTLVTKRQDLPSRGDSSVLNQWVIWQSIRFNWLNCSTTTFQNQNSCLW